MGFRTRCLFALVLAGCTGTHGRSLQEAADEINGGAGAGSAAPAPSPSQAGAASPGTAGRAPAAGGSAAAEPGRPDDPGTNDAGGGAGSSEPDAGPDEGSGSDPCRPTFTRLASIDAETPFDYTAADILAFATGTHATAIRWQPAQGRFFGASYTPESGEHGLTVGVRYDGGELRVMHREGDPDRFFDPGSSCGSRAEWLEIDVELEVTSDAGALAESRAATLIVHNALWVTIAERGPERETTCTRIAADEFGGSFAVVASEPEGYALREACLELYLSAAGVTGQMWGTLERPSAEPGSDPDTFELDFARIGDPGCDRVGGLAIDLDEDAFGITGRSVLERIASVPVVDGTWQDGSRTEVSLTIDHGEGPACTEVRKASGGWLQLESRLRVETDDGRIDATWPVDVFVERDDAGMYSDVNVMLPEGTAFDELGIAGVDTSAYELVTTVAGLALTSTPSGVDVEGGLEITGLVQIDCPLPPPGAPPCPENQLLDSMTWSAP